MKNKEIICNKCLMEIKEREDLITTFDFYELVSYHLECYSKDLKGMKTITVSNEPINGTWSTISAILLSIAGFILIFFGSFRVLGMILFVFPLIRLYSWFKIERYLE